MGIKYKNPKIRYYYETKKQLLSELGKGRGVDVFQGHISPKIRNDRDFILELCDCDISYVRFASDELMEDRNFILEGLTRWGLLPERVAEIWKKDKDICALENFTFKCMAAESEEMDFVKALNETISQINLNDKAIYNTFIEITKRNFNKVFAKKCTELGVMTQDEVPSYVKANLNSTLKKIIGKINQARVEQKEIQNQDFLKCVDEVNRELDK